MNTSLHPAAEQWVGIINGELACHAGIIQFPMRKGWKRVHRLVVLPDYQGVGIGTLFQNNIAKRYIDNGFNVNCTTTTPALVGSMRRDKQWGLVRFGRSKSGYKTMKTVKKTKLKALTDSTSENRITYSFNFKK